MVTKAELIEVVGRVLAGRDADARLCALALQRYLVGDGRRGVFDKRAYQRDYMRAYRARLRDGKRKVRRKR